MSSDETQATAPSELPSRTCLGILQLLLFLRRRALVAGPSMEPLLHDGDTVLVDPRAYRTSAPGIGDIVLARHPTRGGIEIVKRVATVLDDGRLDLRGDNAAESTDSRSLGPVSRGHLLGRVTARFP